MAKDGKSKIVDVCDLPLTGARVVSTIITDLVCTRLLLRLLSQMRSLEVSANVTDLVCLRSRQSKRWIDID